VDERDFGAIVFDNGMPAMTGIELLVQLRAREDCMAVPAILVTGDVTIDLGSRRAELGPLDYMTKPFAADALVALVEAALRRPITPGDHANASPTSRRMSSSSPA
jgi:DNA-binding response OmpR family regulator